MLSNLRIGDFLQGKVIARIRNNYYKVVVDNSFIISAYYEGSLSINGKYIFKVISKQAFGKLCIELLSAYDERENISYFIAKFPKLSLLKDNSRMHKIAELYLEYNLEISEDELIHLYNLIEEYRSVYKKDCSIKDCIILRTKGIKAVDLISYMRDILFIEKELPYKEDFCFFDKEMPFDNFKMCDIIFSFYDRVLKALKSGQALEDKLYNIAFVERMSFLKSSIGNYNFCFFTFPIFLFNNSLGFLSLKLILRKNTVCSIHFSLRNKDHIEELCGVAFSFLNKINLRIMSNTLGNVSIKESVRSSVIEKNYSYIRTINGKNQSAEKISNITYGLFSYAFCSHKKYYNLPFVMYFLFEKIVYNIGMLLLKRK